MRIRGRRGRDAAGNPSLPIPPLYSAYQPPPPPSPLADGRPESPDARQDESPPASSRDRIEPSSPRSSPQTASPSASCRFCDECEDADRGEKGRYAQLSDILKGLPARSYRSSIRKCKSEPEASSSHSDAEAKNKLDLLCAVCSNTDLLDSQSDECKDMETWSCSDDQESKPERSQRGNSMTKSLRGRGKRSTSWGLEMSHRLKATRVNNSHWTVDEVNQLVDGVSTLGVGRWTELKSTYFSTSIRNAQHLKDKWRNLLIACGLQIGKKKKVEAIRMTDDLRARIIALHERHIATKKKRGSED